MALQPAAPLARPDALLVVCLCAQWCHVCEDYRSRFAQVQQNVLADYPQTQFLWIDVEDQADLLEPLDIDDFPTILLATGAVPRFFGPISPQLPTLERLVRHSAADWSGVALADPALHALVARLLVYKK
ncbi:MAG: thioredoxin family protein [Rhodoferax sp.]